MKHLYKGIAGLIASLLLLTGCEKQSPSSSAPTATTTTESTTTTNAGVTDPTSPPTTSSVPTTEPSGQEPGVTDPNTNPTGTQPAPTKVISAEQGKNYLIVRPVVNHPGVVGLDAHYEISVSDKMQNVFASDDYTLKTDTASVKISGNVVTVPWVRAFRRQTRYRDRSVEKRTGEGRQLHLHIPAIFKTAHLCG